MLEAVISQDLWFWHAYFGPPGTNNDINVLQQSPLFITERNGTAPKVPFTVNGHVYKRGYYLADGGYPKWAVFVQAYSFPIEPAERKFKRLQEAARKDVERAFGALKTRWGILNRSMRPRSKEKIANMVYACIILHNMLIREDGRAISPVHIRDPPVQPVLDDTVLIELRHQSTYHRLRNDLTEHIASLELPYLVAAANETKKMTKTKTKTMTSSFLFMYFFYL